MTQATSTPISKSLSAIQLAFESTIRPVVSSSPVDRMAARSIMTPLSGESPSGEPKDQPGARSRVHPGHQVVPDHAEAEGHPTIDHVRRPRLHHVEDAEEHQDQRGGAP